jgi:hypothetical protein
MGMSTSVRRPVAFVALALLAVACTPASGSPGPTTTSAPGDGVPVIAAFTPSPTIAVAPALVALSWSVSDPQGTPLTCSIDGDGDGTTDVTVANCQTPGSRNVSLPSAGSYRPRLTVSDGALAASATTLVSVGAGSTEAFNIVIRPVAPLAAGVQATFDAAAARWSQILVRGIPDASGTIPAGTCLTGSAAITTVDDLVIDVEVAPRDGPGGVLGSAGPCILGSDGLTRVGSMSFDSADVTALAAGGQLQDVVLHEMGHVLGIGTLWTNVAGLTSGFSGPDPRFLGARAVASWSALGRTGGVPVEADGGPGTAYGHWDETTFGNELMTGWINSGPNPLSAVSIASLADLGYRVDLGRADAYSPPSPLFRTFADGLGAPVGREVLRGPVGTI